MHSVPFLFAHSEYLGIHDNQVGLLPYYSLVGSEQLTRNESGEKPGQIAKQAGSPGK